MAASAHLASRRTWVLLALVAIGLLVYRWVSRHEPGPRPQASTSASREGEAPAERSPEASRSGRKPGEPGREAPEKAEETAADEPASTATTLVLRLADAASRRALARESFAVKLMRPGSTVARRVQSDDRGVATVAGVHPGEYSLTVRHADYLPGHRVVRIETSPEGTPPSDVAVDVLLEAGVCLSGEVVTAEGEPIAEASLSLVGEGAASLERARGATASDGSFLVCGLRPGPWSVTAGHPGYRRARLRVVVPEDAEVRIELPEDPGFTIRVVDSDGVPIRDVQVDLLQRTGGLPLGVSSAKTDAAGEVSLSGLPADPGAEVAVRARHPEFPEVLRRFATGRLLEAPQEIVLDRGGSVEVWVVDAAGSAVRNAEATLLERGGPLRRMLKTTSAGEARFERVPTGEYELVAISPSGGVGRTATLRVGGEDGSPAVVVQIEAGSGVIAGVVLDDRGSPVELCPIRIVLPVEGASGDPGKAPEVRAMTGEDGSFQVESLPVPEGTSVRVRVGDARRTTVEELEVTVSRGDLVVDVQRLGSLRGLVSAAGAVGGYSVVLDPEGGGAEGKPRLPLHFHLTSHDRWFELTGLRPGRYQVTIVSGDEVLAGPTSVEIRPGEETGPVEL